MCVCILFIYLLLLLFFYIHYHLLKFEHFLHQLWILMKNSGCKQELEDIFS